MADEPGLGVDLAAHAHAGLVGRQPALLQEGQQVDAGASADRRHEEVERRRRATLTAGKDRLVGLYGEALVVGVHSLAAREVDLHITHHGPSGAVIVPTTYIPLWVSRQHPRARPLPRPPAGPPARHDPAAVHHERCARSCRGETPAVEARASRVGRLDDRRIGILAGLAFEDQRRLPNLTIG